MAENNPVPAPGDVPDPAQPPAAAAPAPVPAAGPAEPGVNRTPSTASTTSAASSAPFGGFKGPQGGKKTHKDWEGSFQSNITVLPERVESPIPRQASAATTVDSVAIAVAAVPAAAVTVVPDTAQEGSVTRQGNAIDFTTKESSQKLFALSSDQRGKPQPSMAEMLAAREALDRAMAAARAVQPPAEAPAAAPAEHTPAPTDDPLPSPTWVEQVEEKERQREQEAAHRSDEDDSQGDRVEYAEFDN